MRKAHSHLLSFDPNTKTYKFPENVVLAITDDANSLQRKQWRYTGLDYLVGKPTEQQKTVAQLYNELFHETTCISAVVYVYPMSAQLDEDSLKLARRAAQHGCHAAPGR